MPVMPQPPHDLKQTNLVSTSLACPIYCMPVPYPTCPCIIYLVPCSYLAQGNLPPCLPAPLLPLALPYACLPLPLPCLALFLPCLAWEGGEEGWGMGGRDQVCLVPLPVPATCLPLPPCLACLCLTPFLLPLPLYTMYYYYYSYYPSPFPSLNILPFPSLNTCLYLPYYWIGTWGTDYPKYLMMILKERILIAGARVSAAACFAIPPLSSLVADTALLPTILCR